MQCLAVERNCRCRLTTIGDSKWCRMHEEAQAKSMKSYKRVSFELEACPIPKVNKAEIMLCDAASVLASWASQFRRKWILTTRTIDSRRKHHALFYSGGDISHQAFISNLATQQKWLEESLLAIDDRAYALLVRDEKASWLNVPVAKDPICTQEADLEIPARSPTGVVVNKSSIQAEIKPDTSPRRLSSTSSVTSSDGEGAFSESLEDEDTASSVSCTSMCCQSAPEIVSDRQRLRKYLDFSNLFDRIEESALAKCAIENIFRTVISRTPRLLVRVRACGASDVNSLVDVLPDEDCARLWRAMTYSNVHNEGKITVKMIYSAICEATTVTQERNGSSISLLGGTVWKESMFSDLSNEGWDLFYRFISCNGCALSVTPSLHAWSRTRRLAVSGSRYSGWAESDESPLEQRLRSCGALLCGGFKKGKIGTIEHVKPQKRGLKSVWIERDSRNWFLLRFPEDSMLPIRFLRKCPKDVQAWVWPEVDASQSQEKKPIWMTRLRSGNSPHERKSARWTPDSEFRYSECTHRKLLSTSPETVFRKGQPFSDSVDLLLVDCGIAQDYSRFIDGVCAILRAEADHSAVAEPPLDDAALQAARCMFRER